MRSSRPDRLRLGQARVVSAVLALQSSSPIKSGPIVLTTSTIQLGGHLSVSSAAMSLLGNLPRHSETEIVHLCSVCLHSVETKPDCLCRDHLGSISAESDSASAEKSQQSSTDPLYAFDPEIELTLRRLRKLRNVAVNTSSSVDPVINSNQLYTDNSVSSSNIFAEPEQMENNDRTLKELATPNVVYQPWCIQYPQLEPAQTYELKSGLIHLLPKFHGLAGEDPHKHLKEFHVVCSTMRPQGISEDYIKMKAFPFSLDGAAKDWLYLQPVLFNTWGDMKRTFLEKFFPASRTASIRKEICGIRQHTGETLHEYWERFNKLYATCPHHQISEQLLI
ncbi:hypothetical protein CR513_43564, partial [Mucuna pruriens]